MKVEIPNHLLVKVSGMVSRGIKEAEINEEGILVFTLTDGTKLELGSVKGDQGPRGESGVYVGTGEMPEGCNVQIDPSGAAFEFIQPPKTASIGQALLVKSIDETGKPTEWETGEVTGGTGGTSDHRKLSNRDAADQHTIGAITGLEAALDGKQPTGSYLTNEALAGAVDDALAQAKASGEFDGADGKTAYQYAQGGGYTGTEAEFAEKMAAEIPAIDNTLSKAGQAADAAKVGEEISSLSEEMLTEESDPTVPSWAKAAQKPSYTASEVGADPSGTAASQVAAHNTGTDTHSDIRLLISGLTDRLNDLADSDDTTLDQLSEVVAYIKSNRGLIEAITTNKVSVADIVDNLTTNVANKPLSAAQGVALKALIDAISVPDKLPNPNALTFTGAVTGSYDGSAPLSVEIPSGGGDGGNKPTIIFDSGEITEEVNIIGPIDISKYSRIRIFGKVYPSSNSAGKRALQIYFQSFLKRILCNAGNGKLFDTSGNPVSFLVYLHTSANAISTHSYSGFNAGSTFDDIDYAVSSMANVSDGGSLVYSTTYDFTQMHLSAQDDLSTRPFGIGTRIMVIGDE